MADTITLNFAELSSRDKYKIMIGTIVPRPIAWITTVDKNGVPNAAPYSFFGCLSSDPPIIGLGVEFRPDGRSKDTARNIRDTGEFTVNIVSHALVQAMNITAIPYEESIDETEKAGLSLVAGTHVSSHSISDSPASLECRLHSFIDLGNSREVILGEIVAARLRKAVVNERYHVDADLLDAIGRMGGSAYTTTRDRFDVGSLVERDVT